MVYSLISCMRSAQENELANTQQITQKEAVVLAIESVILVLLATVAASLSYFGYNFLPPTVIIGIQGGAIAWIIINMTTFVIQSCKQRSHSSSAEASPSSEALLALLSDPPPPDSPPDTPPPAARSAYPRTPMPPHRPPAPALPRGAPPPFSLSSIDH